MLKNNQLCTDNKKKKRRRKGKPNGKHLKKDEENKKSVGSKDYQASHSSTDDSTIILGKSSTNFQFCIRNLKKLTYLNYRFSK